MIVDKKEFCEYIENESDMSNVDYIDATLNACDVFNIDPDLVDVVLNRSIKDKLKVEFINLNFIKPDYVKIM